ncbi:MAG TPA: Gfo/Idh/MocA family oxidoreductase [Panacibacter sp.]|nr:Gfo/Idh/MocA family oxidoreductase [Panacibacter sp.]
MDNPIKTAIIGFGAAGKFMHAPFLATQPENYEITTVLERRLEESKHLFPNANVVRSIDELLLSNEVELVIITTPNDTHFPYAKAALEAGKNVVLEKPFTINTSDALELISLANDVNKTLSVFQNRRYVSDFLTIKEILGKQLLGPVHEFEAHYHRFRPEAKPNAWREENTPGSGILYDLGSHLIDQALCLFGLPDTVTADIRLQRPHARTVDNFELKLDYGFTKVILKSGMLVREPGPRYMIHGTSGSFLKYGEDPQEVFLRAGKLPTEVQNWGIENEEYDGLLHTEINGNLIKTKYPSLKGDYGYYYQNLYKTIRENMPLRERAEHGYNTIRIVELAIESNKLKTTVACNHLLNTAYPKD